MREKSDVLERKDIFPHLKLVDGHRECYALGVSSAGDSLFANLTLYTGAWGQIDFYVPSRNREPGVGE